MSTVFLLPSPELQFADANGVPLAGGTLATYITGTSTPKATWQDAGQVALNSNPIVLDSAGRCIVYGDGGYRLVLKDALGNQIWDQPSATVSAAMAPVVEAATIADAVALLGIQAMINATVALETARAEAAEGTLLADLNAEIARAEAAEGTLLAALNAEIARAEAAEAALAGSIPGTTGMVSAQSGTGVTDSNGRFSVAFSPHFAHSLLMFWAIGGTPGAPAITIAVPEYVDGVATFPSIIGWTDTMGNLITANLTGVTSAALSTLGAYDPSWPYQRLETAWVSTPFRWWAIGY